MEGISFDEEQPITRAVAPVVKKQPLFHRLVIAWGLAKTDKEAERVLIVVVVLGFIITIGMSIFAFDPPHATIPQSVIDAENARLEQGRQ